MPHPGRSRMIFSPCTCTRLFTPKKTMKAPMMLKASVAGSIQSERKFTWRPATKCVGQKYSSAKKSPPKKVTSAISGAPAPRPQEFMGQRQQYRAEDNGHDQREDELGGVVRRSEEGGEQRHLSRPHEREDMVHEFGCVYGKHRRHHDSEQHEGN